MTGCVRPGCGEAAEANLVIHRGEQLVEIIEITDLIGQRFGMALCGPHLAKTRPPGGWAVVDRRRSTADTTPASSNAPPLWDEPPEPEAPPDPAAAATDTSDAAVAETPAASAASAVSEGSAVSAVSAVGAGAAGAESATSAGEAGGRGEPARAEGKAVWVPERNEDGPADVEMVRSPLLRRAFLGIDLVVDSESDRIDLVVGNVNDDGGIDGGVGGGIDGGLGGADYSTSVASIDSVDSLAGLDGLDGIDLVGGSVDSSGAETWSFVGLKRVENQIDSDPHEPGRGMDGNRHDYGHSHAGSGHREEGNVGVGDQHSGNHREEDQTECDHGAHPDSADIVAGGPLESELAPGADVGHLEPSPGQMALAADWAAPDGAPPE